MIRGEEDSVSIPTDLVVEILSRLPASSIARFSCLSKQWGSMLTSPYFTELFLTRSTARPRLLVAVQRHGGDWCFFTSPHPQNPYEKSSSSLVVTADSHIKFIEDDKRLEYYCHASGLIYFRADRCLDERAVICNPITGQCVSLSLPSGQMENGMWRQSISWRIFLGFDPIEKQFKLLFISSSKNSTFNRGEKGEQEIQIMTLGDGKYSWRKIHFPLVHYPKDEEGTCINGVLYYLSKKTDEVPSMIVCFDVRSEKFTFVLRDLIHDLGNSNTKLINYKGKLGVINLRLRRKCSRLELCMWVINDVEKPKTEWWEYVYTFRETQKVDDDCYLSITELFVSGVTASGDIVLSIEHPYISDFHVFYLSPERNTLKSVEIKGIGGNHFEYYGKAMKCRGVKIFVDHVEDLNFINMKAAFGDAVKSIIPPEQKRKPTTTSTSAKAHLRQVGRKFVSFNKFDSLCLSDDDEFS